MSDNSNAKALELFHYEPTKIAPEVFMALFTLAAIAFTVRIYRSKSGKWLYILSYTALAEAIGYGFRTACTIQTTLTLYILMMFFLLLPPIALALVNYKALAKIVEIKAEQFGMERDPFWLRPRFVATFFFWSDICTFLIQGSGGGLTASASLQTIGSVIVLVSLGIQIFSFACFTATAVIVARRTMYDYKVVHVPSGEPTHNPKLQAMRCLFATIILLYIRSIYRLAEYASGYGGVVASAEWAFYLFDSVMIFGCFICYFVIFLGDYLPNGVTVVLVKQTDSQQYPLKPLY